MPRYVVIDEKGKEKGEYDEHAPEVAKARTTPGWGFRTVSDGEIRERELAKQRAAEAKKSAPKKAAKKSAPKKDDGSSS